MHVQKGRDAETVLLDLQEGGILTRDSCKFRRGLDGSENADDRGGFLPPTAARADQCEASVGSAGRPDRLESVEHGDERKFRVTAGPAGNLASPDCGASVLAARIRPVGRGRGLAMAREPVLAGVHRRGVFADEAADRSVEPDALAQTAV